MNECGSVMRMGRARRGGFTLTEILVALAIMVILFALLFAPMMAGLDWVATGRANVNLQDACRLAMEQMRRELSEAVFVHPTPGVDFPGPDGAWSTSDDIRVCNYSQVLFNPPERDGSGRVVSPPHAAIDDGPGGSGLPIVVRYRVRPVFPGLEYSEDNPFALYREEFLWNTGMASPLGSFDSAMVWQPDVPLNENALTPKRGSTFLPTTSVAYSVAGGVVTSLTPTVFAGFCTLTAMPGNTDVMYLFDGLQFTPERITGEMLHTTNDVLYRSKYPGWDGTSLSYYPASGGFLPIYAVDRSDLDPTIVLYRYQPGTGGWTGVPAGMDTRIEAVRTVSLRWSGDSGSVTCGQQARTLVAGNYVYYKPVSFTGGGGAAWYTTNAPAEVAPIRPSAAAAPQDTANAPIAYRIDPSLDGTGWPAVIQEGTIKARIVAVEQATGRKRIIDLKPTGNFAQESIRGDEFCPLVYRRDYSQPSDGIPEGTCAEVRLSRYDPPRPTSTALFGPNPPAFSSFELQLVYYYRRNYAYDPIADAEGRDPFVADRVKVDYSTRAIQNVAMTLQRYVELEEPTTPGVYALPPDEVPNSVPLREQVIVRNFPRTG